MAKLAARAERQIQTFIDYFSSLDRIEAIDRLNGAVSDALRALDGKSPPRMLPFPSVYEVVRKAGTQWFKVHRYWFSAERINGEWIIENVYFDTANIPVRFPGRQ